MHMLHMCIANIIMLVRTLVMKPNILSSLLIVFVLQSIPAQPVFVNCIK